MLTEKRNCKYIAIHLRKQVQKTKKKNLKNKKFTKINLEINDLEW